MSEARPHRTTCDRCGTTLRYRFGAAPDYCDDCHNTIHRRGVA